MKLNPLLIAFASLVLICVSGCSWQQAYYTGQAWQRNECNKMAGQSERERCLSKASTTYEDYKRQTDDGKK